MYENNTEGIPSISNKKLITVLPVHKEISVFLQLLFHGFYNDFFMDFMMTALGHESAHPSYFLH